MGILKKSTPKKTEERIIPDEKDGIKPFVAQQKESLTEEELSGEEGQLAVDVFQTADEIVVVAPVAGVVLEDLSITITDEVLSIKGRRNLQFNVQSGDYFTQECFWGDFSRSIILPESVDTGKVKASFKNGILTVRVPKVEKKRIRMVAIQEE